jgi:hypothetical protein
VVPGGSSFPASVARSASARTTAAASGPAASGPASGGARRTRLSSSAGSTEYRKSRMISCLLIGTWAVTGIPPRVARIRVGGLVHDRSARRRRRGRSGTPGTPAAPSPVGRTAPGPQSGCSGSASQAASRGRRRTGHRPTRPPGSPSPRAIDLLRRVANERSKLVAATAADEQPAADERLRLVSHAAIRLWRSRRRSP